MPCLVSLPCLGSNFSGCLFTACTYILNQKSSCQLEKPFTMEKVITPKEIPDASSIPCVELIKYHHVVQCAVVPFRYHYWWLLLAHCRAKCAKTLNNIWWTTIQLCNGGNRTKFSVSKIWSDQLYTVDIKYKIWIWHSSIGFDCDNCIFMLFLRRRINVFFNVYCFECSICLFAWFIFRYNYHQIHPPINPHVINQQPVQYMSVPENIDRVPNRTIKYISVPEQVERVPDRPIRYVSVPEQVERVPNR